MGWNDPCCYRPREHERNMPVRLFFTTRPAFTTERVANLVALGPLRVRNRRDRDIELLAVLPLSISFSLPALSGGRISVVAELLRDGDVIARGELAENPFNSSVATSMLAIASTLTLLAVDESESGIAPYTVRVTFAADPTFIAPLLTVGTSTLTATSFPEKETMRILES